MPRQPQHHDETTRKRTRASTNASSSANSSTAEDPSSNIPAQCRSTTYRQSLSITQRNAQNARRRLLRQNQQSNMQNHINHVSTSTDILQEGHQQDGSIGEDHQLPPLVPNLRAPVSNSARIGNQISHQQDGPIGEDHQLPPLVPNLRAPLRNSARIGNQIVHVPRMELPEPTFCIHCQAKLFYKESKNLCCNNGKVIIPAIPAPPELLELFTQQGSIGRHFRQNVRAYNHVFSFTSMGVTLDETVPSFAQGIYTFRAHGALYHRIGPLLPTPGNRPRFLQMFIYDTDCEMEHRLDEGHGLDVNILHKIKTILDVYNPFVRTFRQISQHPQIHSCKLLIQDRPATDRQYILPTASQVAAVLVGGEDFMESDDRDILICSTTGNLVTLKEHTGYYDPMQYPLLHPHGSYGWDKCLQSNNGGKISCSDYYASLLQIRNDNQSILLRAGRLLQQFVVDNYIKIETQKLRWIQLNQNKIRAELYQGLQDSFAAGETDAGAVGRRTILPSSFIGSPRDMYQRYQDAMTIVQQYGKPDVFLTMTCNSNWKEIKDELYPGQAPHERPDLLARVFQSKCESLKDDIFHKGVLGKVVGHVHMIEFQKRGLPHVHMLIIFEEHDKLASPDEYDSIVRAEIPQADIEPELHEAVRRHMIHGPCGRYNPNAPCTKQFMCKKGYPKPYAECTMQGIDSYPIYRRRRSTINVDNNIIDQNVVDNSWVVPYNPYLLLKYDCHINVEICCSIKSIKYLYKYIHKGSDRIAMEVRTAPNYDEVNKYVDGRWICAPEAMWKMFKFEMTRMYPSVLRLQLHLPNLHQIQYNSNQQIANVLASDRNCRTMLTEFFRIYNDNEENEKYLYRDFPKRYRWLIPQRKWIQRCTNTKAIGRIYSVSPSEGEKFYLRLLLNHIAGPTSFKCLQTVDGVIYSTFKQAAEKFGLLEEDNNIRDCMAEARTFRMPSGLRRLFTTILLYSTPSSVRELWDENFQSMIEDYTCSSTAGETYMMSKLLTELDGILQQHNKSIKDFDLPRISDGYANLHQFSSLIEHELSIPISEDDLKSIDCLNSAQSYAFNIINASIKKRESAIYFVDGPGGTGKTFLYRSILAYFRTNCHIVLATATSGIAANLLPGGRTAHSKFRIPIDLDSVSSCGIAKQSDLRVLIEQSCAIIWDEAPMAHRKAFEAVDRTFKDVLGVNLPFGGKVLIMGGDFRQVTPVVVHGTKAQIINSSIVESYLWSHVKVLHLTENMRAHEDTNFSNFLLRVGDGEETTIEHNKIRIPDSMVVPWEEENSIDALIALIFPNLGAENHDDRYMDGRAILTPLNEDVNKINEKCLASTPGEKVTYYSFDSVTDDVRNLYLPEFLNSLNPGNLPPHELTLKIGCPIMLLRNIDPKIGLCNGTRLKCIRFSRNVIEAEILNGLFNNTRVFIPRMPLNSAEDARMPFELIRKQFPVRLSYALTINKSQGQTIKNVGIYLPNPVFSHGQLYVALSRGVSEQNTKVLVKNGTIDGHEGVYTANVVYKEIFSRLRPNGTGA